MKKKKIFSDWNFLLVGSLLMVMLSFFVSALGIGSDGSKLQLYPGETRDTSFLLQNYGAESSNIVVEATVEEGSEYISFPDGNSFSVSANGNFVVPVRYSISESAKIGDIYSVKVLFRVVSEDVGSGKESGGTSIEFAVNPRVVIEIEVAPKNVREQVPIVAEEKTSAGSTVWIWILAVLVLIIIAWMIWKKKNNN